MFMVHKAVYHVREHSTKCVRTNLLLSEMQQNCHFPSRVAYKLLQLSH